MVSRLGLNILMVKLREKHTVRLKRILRALLGVVALGVSGWIGLGWLFPLLKDLLWHFPSRVALFLVAGAIGLYLLWSPISRWVRPIFQRARPISQRARQRLQEEPWSLFKASCWVLVGLVVFAALLWLGLGWVLGGKWAWELPAGDEANKYALLRMVLFVGAGVVGVIGVLVTYRRQRGIEEGQFLEQLATSARQLGDENPTVQAAGIYALAGLADRSSKSRRQECVNVLCTYLRLPYTPPQENDEPGVTTGVIIKRTVNTETGPAEEERTVSVHPHDREIRQSIVRVITRHLRKDKDDEVSWSNLDLDFTGAVFDYADFSKACFSGGTVSFRDATFSGGRVSFEDATFSGGTVSFRGATFSSGRVSFRGARFSGGRVSFWGARFSGGTVDFQGARFSGGTVDFQGATFFGDNTVDFQCVRFSSGYVSFWEARFSGGTIDLKFAAFSGGTVDFKFAAFSGGTVDFKFAAFSGGTVYFGGTVDPKNTFVLPGSTFSGGIVDFQFAAFSEGTIDFQSARFSGGRVSFLGATFSGSTVNFENPQSWDTPPEMPWRDGDKTPEGICPDRWPPVLGTPSGR